MNTHTFSGQQREVLSLSVDSDVDRFADDFIPWSMRFHDFITANQSLVDLRALEKNTTLKSLTIRDKVNASGLPEKGQIQYIQESTYADSLAKNTSLIHLTLENLMLGGSIRSLADAIRQNKTLRSLKIIDDSLTRQDLNTLRGGLVFNTTLVELKLSEHLSKFESYFPVMSIIAHNQADTESDDKVAVRDGENIQEKCSVHDTVVLKKELDAAMKELKRHKQISTDLLSKYESLEHVIVGNRESFSKLERENNELKQQVSVYMIEESSKTSAFEQLTRENERLNDKCKRLLMEIGRMQAEYNLKSKQAMETSERLAEELKRVKEENQALLAGKRLIDIPYDEIILDKSIANRIGAGGYGEVFKAQWHSQNVAVKGIKISDIETGKINNLVHEARTIMRLHHKHVVLSMGTTMNPDTTEIMLVMEYMKHGSLEDLLFKQHVKLQHYQMSTLALDIAKGLNYLHCLTPKIIHRDLKCANILLYHNKTRAKISDFGTARYLNKNSLAKTCEGGTLGYFAPEILEEEEYNEKADVYSFGIVLLVLATSSSDLPTTRKSDKLRDRIDAILNLSETMAGEHLFRQLVHDCCKISPDERPSMKHCIEVLKGLRLKYSR